jgi:hypothetical protein
MMGEDRIVSRRDLLLRASKLHAENEQRTARVFQVSQDDSAQSVNRTYFAGVGEQPGKKWTGQPL